MITIKRGNMKNLTLLIMLLFFSGCGPSTKLISEGKIFNKPVADLNYKSSNTEDVYTVMLDIAAIHGYFSVPSLSVISTTNQKKIHHTILSYNEIDSKNFNTADLYNSAFFSDKKARELSLELSKAIKVWNDRLTIQEARDIYYQNVGSEGSFFSFEFQSNSNSAIATIKIEKKSKKNAKEEKAEGVSVIFEDLEELRTLKLLIDKSLAL